MRGNFATFALGIAGFAAIAASLAKFFRAGSNLDSLWLVFAAFLVAIFVRDVVCRSWRRSFLALSAAILCVSVFCNARLSDEKRVQLVENQRADVQLGTVSALQLDEFALPSTLSSKFRAKVTVFVNGGGRILAKVESNRPLVIGRVAILLEKYAITDGFAAIFLIRDIFFAKIAAICALLFVICAVISALTE